MIRQRRVSRVSLEGGQRHAAPVGCGELCALCSNCNEVCPNVNTCAPSLNCILLGIVNVVKRSPPKQLRLL